MRDVKWGVLSTAEIGMKKVIPGIQGSNGNTVYAIASRNAKRAADAAAQAGIPVSYGSYEELLNDPDIEVVYIPLPNHMHVQWSIKAMEAGKHVLCEKPLALKTEDIDKLAGVSKKTGKFLAEGFMVRYHPQWKTAKKVIQNGTVGEVRAIQGVFSYFNADEGNIRNIPEYGGGGIWDIGCYPVMTSRYIFGEEPFRVCALLERDPKLRIDRLGSVIMEFPSGQASFLCSTQLVPCQRMTILGTKGRLELEIPFNAPPDRKSQIYLSRGEVYQENFQLLDFDVCDQYGLQAESFARTIRGEDVQVVSLEDSRKNLKVLEAIFHSAETGKWENVD
ncbi:MAG: NAD-binding protein [Spirochaetaceae bacterium 4572_59]|nr:MAG: NAD-binding protein [Spirochaetaceae bacterium 4572_59]